MRFTPSVQLYINFPTYSTESDTNACHVLIDPVRFLSFVVKSVELTIVAVKSGDHSIYVIESLDW